MWRAVGVTSSSSSSSSSSPGIKENTCTPGFLWFKLWKFNMDIKHHALEKDGLKEKVFSCIFHAFPCKMGLC